MLPARRGVSRNRRPARGGGRGPARRKKPPAKPRAGITRSIIFELSANAIDLDSILGDLERREPAPTAHAKSEERRSGSEHRCSKISRSRSAASPKQRRPRGRRSRQRLRQPARRGTNVSGAPDAAEQPTARASLLQEAGDIDECIAALQNAARSPRLRFSAAALVGRMFEERGQTSRGDRVVRAGRRRRRRRRPTNAHMLTVRARGRARRRRRDGARAGGVPRAAGRRGRFQRRRRASRSAHQSAGGRVALIRRLLYVAFFLEVGLLLVVLPWSAFWEQQLLRRWRGRRSGSSSPTISSAAR